MWDKTWKWFFPMSRTRCTRAKMTLIIIPVIYDLWKARELKHKPIHT